MTGGERGGMKDWPCSEISQRKDSATIISRELHNTLFELAVRRTYGNSGTL